MIAEKTGAGRKYKSKGKNPTQPAFDRSPCSGEKDLPSGPRSEAPPVPAKRTLARCGSRIKDSAALGFSLFPEKQQQKQRQMHAHLPLFSCSCLCLCSCLFPHAGNGEGHRRLGGVAPFSRFRGGAIPFPAPVSSMPYKGAGNWRAVRLGYWQLPRKLSPLTMAHWRTRPLAPSNPLGHNPHWLASTGAKAYSIIGCIG